MHDQWGSHAMTEAEIEELIEAFVQAARRDRDSGFDGTDIFAGYNCLVDQFWSPITNKRDDKWGGSLENRMRFAIEIAARIRAMAGDRYIIGMTISGAEPYPGGLTIADKQEIISYLDQRGLVDYFSCGTGSYLNQFSKIVPSFHFAMLLGADDAAKFKQVVKHARITTEARVKTPENAEKVLSEGKSDMVSIVRGQIADPHLANKAKEGRPEDIRPCISCNQLCLGRRLRDYWVSCISNPSVARETQWDGDSTPPSGKAAPCAGRRRRAGRAGSGAGRGRARPSRHAGGEDRRAGRPVPPRRRPAGARRDRRAAELVSDATHQAAGAGEAAHGSERGGREGRRRRCGGALHRVRRRRARASSAPIRTARACPAPGSRMSAPSMTCSMAR